MADVDNIVPEHLRYIGGAIDDMREDIREIKQPWVAWSISTPVCRPARSHGLPYRAN